VLDGRELTEPVTHAATLLATVLGQDLERDAADGVFRIARRVAKDRVISTVDPDARHGHKTAARGFDGYKGHAAADPDSEIITATTVTPGNTGDATAAEDLIADLLAEQTGPSQTGPPVVKDSTADAAELTAAGPTVYGDNAYGTGEFHCLLGEAGIADRCKTQAPTTGGGLFPKDRFDIDLGARMVRCPAGNTAGIRAAAPVAEPPTSARCAPRARCARSAPPPQGAARSASAHTSKPSPMPAPARPTPPGLPTTAVPAPRSSASSGT
jgi:hypothetical protein